MAGEITLPEITIVGDPDYTPTTPEDFYTKGFIEGYNGQEAQPPMVSETLVFYYDAGVEAGRTAATERQAEIDQMLADQPQLQGDLHGESFAKAEEEYREILEGLMHEHPPHTELPEYSTDQPARILPGIQPVR